MDAFPSIFEALEREESPGVYRVQSGDTLLVAPGNYGPFQLYRNFSYPTGAVLVASYYGGPTPQGSSPCISGCTFQFNQLSNGSVASGAAISILDYCFAVILNCRFFDNTAFGQDGYGGAIGITGFSVALETAPAMADGEMPGALIDSCFFVCNRAQCQGGAVAIVCGSVVGGVIDRGCLEWV
jgi:hypothetical protein